MPILCVRRPLTTQLIALIARVKELLHLKQQQQIVIELPSVGPIYIPTGKK